jgi:hypothetical protein
MCAARTVRLTDDSLNIDSHQLMGFAVRLRRGESRSAAAARWNRRYSDRPASLGPVGRSRCSSPRSSRRPVPVAVGEVREAADLVAVAEGATPSQHWWGSGGTVRHHGRSGVGARVRSSPIRDCAGLSERLVVTSWATASQQEGAIGLVDAIDRVVAGVALLRDLVQAGV